MQQAIHEVLYRRSRIEKISVVNGRAHGGLENLVAQQRAAGERPGKQEVDFRAGKWDGGVAEGGKQIAQAKAEDGKRGDGAHTNCGSACGMRSARIQGRAEPEEQNQNSQHQESQAARRAHAAKRMAELAAKVQSEKREQSDGHAAKPPCRGRAEEHFFQRRIAADVGKGEPARLPPGRRKSAGHDPGSEDACKDLPPATAGAS